MAYDGYIEFNGTELVNLSRTSQLAQVLGIDTVWKTPEQVAWIEERLAESDTNYSDITQAPWYDEGYTPSMAFAGVIPLSVQGLDDTTYQSTPVEYITDGGNPGQSRNATLPLVWNVVIVAANDAGAEFGKRWLDRILRGGDDGASMFCSGSDLRYFRYEDAEAPFAHRRNVKTTRGTSVTNKRVTECASTWWATFTMTAADPYEYGGAVDQFTGLGGTVAGPGVQSFGALVLTQSDCPVYDYSPIYDPTYPALVPVPTAPDFLPNGWGIVDGETFERFYVRLNPLEPRGLNVVPIFALTTDIEARSVRVSIWPSDATNDEQCNPLFSAVVSYLPATGTFYLDGQQKAAYVWDGLGDAVRRSDSLVYGPTAGPVEWPAFSDVAGMLVTLDIFYIDSGLYEGGGDVRASLSFVPKSD